MIAGAARNLSGRAVIITGGGSGVGFECARLFSDAGASVLIIGRKEEKLRGARNTLGNPESVSCLAGDVTRSGFAEEAVLHAHKKFGRHVDILINNAGVILRKTAEETTDEEWRDVMSVNIDGAFYFSRSVASRMENGGAIVNVSSTCGQVGAAGLAAYCASKGALDQLTRSMALELAPRNITVNAVAPGAINSPMLFSRHSGGVSEQAVIEDNLTSIPLDAVAEPVEIARAVLFLASERHITGSILSVDGGYTAQ